NSKTGRRLTAAAIVLIAVTVSVACITTWDLRRDALARATQETDSLGISLAEQNARLIQATDLGLQETQEMVLAAGPQTPDDFTNLMATEKVHDFLVNRMRGVPQADAISLIDANGKVINYSRAWPVPVIDTSAREFFQAMRNMDKAGPYTGPYIGMPF